MHCYFIYTSAGSPCKVVKVTLGHQQFVWCRIPMGGSIVSNWSTKRKLTSLGRHFYFNRIVCLWNALPPIDLEKSAAVLKNHLTQFLHVGWLMATLYESVSQGLRVTLHHGFST